MTKHRVFVSYRRDDAHQVGRIYDHLERTLGRDNVFKDVDSTPPGTDFRRVVEEAVSNCDVLLVVISDGWLNARDKEGQRRLDNPGDFVRFELEVALSHGIPVLPILVSQAAMPAPESLPEAIRALAYRQAIQIRPDPDFRQDIQKLVESARQVALASPREVQRLRAGRRWARGLAAIFAVVAAAALIFAVVVLMRHPPVGHGEQQLYESDPTETQQVGFDTRMELRVTWKVPEKRTRNRDIPGTGPVQEEYTIRVPNVFGLALDPGCLARVYKPLRDDLPWLILVTGADQSWQDAHISWTRPRFGVPPRVGEKMPAAKIPPPDGGR